MITNSFLPPLPRNCGFTALTSSINHANKHMQAKRDLYDPDLEVGDEVVKARDHTQYRGTVSKIERDPNTDNIVKVYYDPEKKRTVSASIIDIFND